MRVKLQELIAVQNEMANSVKNEMNTDTPHTFIPSLINARLDPLLLPSILFTPSERHCYHSQSVYRHHLWNMFVSCFYADQEEIIGANLW